MFNLNYIEQVEKNELLFILNNNGVVPYVDGDKLIILNSSFEMSICDFSINHLNSILGTSIVDSKYVYYFISIAYDNVYFNDDVKRKKKSLWLKFKIISDFIIHIFSIKVCFLFVFTYYSDYIRWKCFC